ncbi:MAG: YicC/YloC family endoribonuclease [Spirochaetota bacterium]
MESMTGYAHVEGSTAQFSYSVEIKSLNNKYLETYINLPRSLVQEEQFFGELLKKYFSRGKLEFSIDIYDWAENRSVSVNTALLKKYYDELCSFRKKEGAEESFSLDSLLSLDGVVQKGRSSIAPVSLSVIKKSAEAAIKKSVEMRKEEGAALLKDLLFCVQVIADSLDHVKKKSVFSPKEKCERLKERIGKLSASVPDENRLYAEIALLADRIDINEEITRLDDHIKKFRATAKEKGQIGKKLDFIAQEMFREANTISSKTASSEVSHLCVEIKNNIEKIREQCRNVV